MTGYSRVDLYMEYLVACVKVCVPGNLGYSTKGNITLVSEKANASLTPTLSYVYTRV